MRPISIEGLAYVTPQDAFWAEYVDIRKLMFSLDGGSVAMYDRVYGRKLRQHHLFVPVFVKNIDNQPRQIASFAAIDDGGAIYAPVAVSATAEDAFSSGETLNPETTKLGVVVFDFQRDANREYTLVIRPAGATLVKVPIRQKSSPTLTADQMLLFAYRHELDERDKNIYDEWGKEMIRIVQEHAVALSQAVGR